MGVRIMITMNVQDIAWLKAQAIYRKGDSGDLANAKAIENGYSPGTQAHAAFISGFLDLVNSEVVIGEV